MMGSGHCVLPIIPQAPADFTRPTSSSTVRRPDGAFHMTPGVKLRISFQFCQMDPLHDRGRDFDVGWELPPRSGAAALMWGHQSITDGWRTAGAVINNIGSLYYVPPGADRSTGADRVPAAFVPRGKSSLDLHMSNLEES